MMMQQIRSRRRRPTVVGLALLGLALGVAGLGVPEAGAGIRVKEHIAFSGLAGLGKMAGDRIVFVSGDRQRTESNLRFTGKVLGKIAGKPNETVEIIRLDKEVFWSLDPEKKSYSEMTFEAMREQVERASEDAKRAAKEAKEEAAEEKGKDAEEPKVKVYPPKVDVKRTGEKKSIIGLEAEHVILTIETEIEDLETHERTKTYLIFDEWLSDKVPGGKEMVDFNIALAQKLGFNQVARDMGKALAQYGMSMKDVADAMKDVSGYPLETKVLLEIQVPPEEAAKAAKEKEEKEEEEKADLSTGGLLKKGAGLFGKKKKDKDEKKEAEAPLEASAPDRALITSMTQTVVEAGESTTDPSLFEIPEGYRLGGSGDR